MEAEKKSLESIRVYCLYIDNDNTIIKVSLNNQPIHNNIVHKDELLKMVHCNTISHNDSKYFFHNMMLYNIHHEIDDVENMVHDDDYEWENYFKDCLYEINMYKDLIVPQSLPAFHDIQSLFIFYHEKKSAIKHGIKHSIQNGVSNRKMTTKRVRINELSNKTRRILP